MVLLPSIYLAHSSLRLQESRRKLKALLNKLTRDNFERISGQIFEQLKSPAQVTILLVELYEKACTQVFFQVGRGIFGVG